MTSILAGWFGTSLLWLGIIVGVVVVVWIVNAAVKANAREEELKRSKAFSDNSLTCQKCGSLARPISGTRNRYRCPQCGRQFAAAKHAL